MFSDRVGIGVTVPSVALNVSGDVEVSGDVRIFGHLFVDSIVSDEDIHISPNEMVVIHQSISVNKTVIVGGGIKLSKGASAVQDTIFGQLYVDALGSLMYLRPDALQPVNISSTFSLIICSSYRIS